MITSNQKEALRAKLLQMLDDYCEAANELEDDEMLEPLDERMADFLIYWKESDPFVDIIKKHGL